MRFAFPRRVGALYQTGKYPALATFEDVVAQDPRLKAYLASERRRPFSSGLFRAYKELDGEE
jgi:glutathione S-transferase